MQKLKLVFVLSAFGFATVGSGMNTAHAYQVQCPRELRATWAGGAYGRVTNFSVPLVTGGYVLLPQSSKTMTCVRSNSTPEYITETIQLSPGSIPALCGGRANVSGPGVVFGIVPFPGILFESGRIDAIPTYNQATGVCRLDLPIRAMQLREQVSKACTLYREEPHWWACPNSSFPTSASLEQRGESFATGNRDAGGRRAFSHYDAFASQRLTIESLLFPDRFGAAVATR